ncbi:Ig-like domain-containing protein [Engelhardtia mirabilis]|uniref:SbsA Ig-like domain-containing protein n=1 Tax=Engelhardtia mirabilis TaxID=2528011 RepID=A0A518BP81_9BACT|nr:hypothetical protein Pla133_38880 [Planctomycetes bacterium Pla133]QDV03112.1 hypothetical protein Pla86_38870 [Planctomycetes bacterium Pla86]
MNEAIIQPSQPSPFRGDLEVPRGSDARLHGVDRAGSARVGGVTVGGGGVAARRAGAALQRLALGFGLVVLASCGGGGGSTGGSASQPGLLGSAAVKPGGSGLLDGNAYIIDENNGGQATEFRIIDMAWGRLVDVYDTILKPGVNQAEYELDPLNTELYDTRLVYPDLLVGEDVRTAFELGFLKWELTSNPVTGESRLRMNANAEVDKTLFSVRVAQAAEGLKPIDPKGFSPTELPPYSLVGRNAALSVRFDDLLDEASIGSNTTIKVFAGEPPVVPFDARIFADPNHGGVSGGKFRTTRVIIDFTISQDELASIGQVVQANGIGLPASENGLDPNVSITIPSKVNTSVGQFSVLKNVKGATINTNDSGPVDFTSPTLDVRWGMRAGNPDDDNNGFLVDLEQPRLIGVQPVSITNAVDPAAGALEDLLLTFEFDVANCALDPIVGDVIQVSEELRFEVIEAATTVGTTAVNVKVDVPFDAPAFELSDLVGTSAQFLTPWRQSLGSLKAPCFVRFSPAAGQLPASQVSPNAKLIVRFSEPFDPVTARPFDTLYIARTATVDASLSETPPGSLISAPTPSDLILGSVIPSPDFREARFSPTVPFEHANGNIETFFFNMVSNLDDGGITDLAGNVLEAELPRVSFNIDPNAASESTGGWVLRFNSADETPENGPEVRGQLLFDLTKGLIQPRPVQRFGAVVDRSQPMVGVMQQITTGLQTPLSSQGSKAHLMWRYMDAGFDVSQTNDLFYNLSIEGLSLSPLGGQVVATIYDEFEISLGHAVNLPDEIIDPNTLLPKYPSSGLGNTASFDENFLEDALAGPQLMHPRQLGFAVSSSDVFVSTTGSPMLQMPWNQASSETDKTFFTWRNNAVQSYGNLNGDSLIGSGAPTEQEVAVLGLSTPSGDVFGPSIKDSNSADTPLGIPSVGLPLLMEYRCYPSEETSLNNFDVSIAVTSSPRPFFRAFSTGGTNAGGLVVNKDPDLQTDPTGGFNGNPAIAPLGQPTAPRDPTVYMGQMDVVIRLSRVYTILMDAEQNPLIGVGNSPYSYVAAVVEPTAAQQPGGTSVTFNWRGDNISSLVGQEAMLDASRLDVYGEPIIGPLSGNGQVADNPRFPWSDPSWKGSLADVAGKRFVQTRITFIGNTASELNPTLNSYGLAFFR